MKRKKKCHFRTNSCFTVCLLVLVMIICLVWTFGSCMVHDKNGINLYLSMKIPSSRLVCIGTFLVITYLINLLQQGPQGQKLI